MISPAFRYRYRKGEKPMPLVTVVEVMPAPVNRVWEVVNDIESYPRLMKHVRSVEVRERGLNYRVSTWEVELKGCIMRWIEHEEINAAQYRIEYHQVEGEMQTFEGIWQLEQQTDETTRVTLSVQFDVGIPSLCEMLNPICERAILDSSQGMLLSLASAATQQPARPTPHGTLASP
jgi:ribosome-associated toxin RatA of RatAB toxin-antitoxin module